jgi:hypothetical protein
MAVPTIPVPQHREKQQNPKTVCPFSVYFFLYLSFPLQCQFRSPISQNTRPLTHCHPTQQHPCACVCTYVFMCVCVCVLVLAHTHRLIKKEITTTDATHPIPPCRCMSSFSTFLQVLGILGVASRCPRPSRPSQRDPGAAGAAATGAGAAAISAIRKRYVRPIRITGTQSTT